MSKFPRLLVVARFLLAALPCDLGDVRVLLDAIHALLSCLRAYTTC